MQSQGLPSQLGVRPAPELANRFLIQSFGWMFAAVLITAVVAVPILGNESFLNWAYRSWSVHHDRDVRARDRRPAGDPAGDADRRAGAVLRLRGGARA